MKCEKCHAMPATERHHKFSQTKVNKRLYGQLIHDPRNIQLLCYDCHHNKPVDKWTEKEFCSALGILPRSKTERTLWARNQDHQGISTSRLASSHVPIVASCAVSV